MDINEGAYQRHLTDPHHLGNLAEQVDVSSSVFLTPPPSPPQVYYQPDLEDDYVPEFSESETESDEDKPLPELPPPPRSPRLEDADPQVSDNAPWRYYNRAWLLEGIGDRVEDDDGDEEEDEPLRFFE